MLSRKSLVICGPSGVGKGTLISRILSKHPLKFSLSVSHTTRLPRPGEVDGIHYHFITKLDFKNKLSASSPLFLEHAEVHGNFYGTSFPSLDRIHSEGKLSILDVDVKGVKNIKQSKYQSGLKYIFVAPPELSSLELRLRGRGTEKEESIQMRLRNSNDELRFGTEGHILSTSFFPNPSIDPSSLSSIRSTHFDAVIVNDQVDRASEEILSLTRTWFPEMFSS